MKKFIGAIMVSVYLLGAMSASAAASETAFPGQGMLGDALEDKTDVDDKKDTEEGTGVEELTNTDKVVPEEEQDAAVPATGDASGQLLWLCLAVAAGTTLAVYRIKSTKRSES